MLRPDQPDDDGDQVALMVLGVRTGAEGGNVKYRSFGNLDWQVSALGFGCMRLPTKNGREAIEEREATRMVRAAIEGGVNYLDTGYSYHGGNSEPFVGRVLEDGYRERVRVATKMPSWKIAAWDDFDQYLGEQCERLRMAHVDFYLLHGLNRERWDKLRKLGVLEWAEGAAAEGRIGYLGFSFHDKYEVFKEIVDAHDWTFCQIQYNYMDIENQAGRKGLNYAASKGMAVVVMEPLLGGRLVAPPKPVRDIWKEAPTERTPAAWGLQWLWNQPEVSAVLSGMSTMEQVKENVATAGRSGVGTLSDEEVSIVQRVREAYEELCPIPCTQCNYCMPCPHGVDIPRNLEIYNEGIMYEKPESARRSYGFLEEDKRASACTACLECEDQCPQGIAVSQWMTQVHDVLGKGESFARSLRPS